MFFLQKMIVLWLYVNGSAGSPQILVPPGFISWGMNKRVKEEKLKMGWEFPGPEKPNWNS